MNSYNEDCKNYPSKVYTYNVNGYQTTIIRSIQGTWNGYVVLPKNHKYDNKSYDNIPVNVHGGLSYSQLEPSGWVIGFDTAHAGDFIPTLSYLHRQQQFEHYWTHSEVIAELIRLIEQL
jgi:hypothetical protein